MISKLVLRDWYQFSVSGAGKTRRNLFFVRSLHAVNDDAKNKLQQSIAKQTS